MNMLQGIADPIFEPLFAPLFGTPDEIAALTGALLAEDGTPLLAEDGSALLSE